MDITSQTFSRPVQVDLHTPGMPPAFVVPILPADGLAYRIPQQRNGVPVNPDTATNANSPNPPVHRPVAEFLFHLTRMLTDPSNSRLIEWTDGKIRVHDPHRLESDVLGRYFRHSKCASFQRQLNYFGFRKVDSKGKMSPCWYINPDTTHDLTSLLGIRRRTTARAGRRGGDTSETAGGTKRTRTSYDRRPHGTPPHNRPRPAEPEDPSSGGAKHHMPMTLDSNPFLATSNEYGPPGSVSFSPPSVTPHSSSCSTSSSTPKSAETSGGEESRWEDLERTDSESPADQEEEEEDGGDDDFATFALLESSFGQEDPRASDSGGCSAAAGLAASCPPQPRPLGPSSPAASFPPAASAAGIPPRPVTAAASAATGGLPEPKSDLFAGFLSMIGPQTGNSPPGRAEQQVQPSPFPMLGLPWMTPLANGVGTKVGGMKASPSLLMMLNFSSGAGGI